MNNIIKQMTPAMKEYLKAKAVSYVWDSSAGKVVFGMNVVLLIWTDVSYIRLRQTEKKSKIKILLRFWIFLLIISEIERVGYIYL